MYFKYESNVGCNIGAFNQEKALQICDYELFATLCLKFDSSSEDPQKCPAVLAAVLATTTASR